MESILATAWDERLADAYDVIVVGSGYGGAITAARLANARITPKLKICLLERGREWPIGSFPDTMEHVVEQTYNPTLNPLGLYQIDVHTAISVLRGSGLGGTSLVNANVAIRPGPECFDTWPAAIRQAAQIPEGSAGSLWNYYRRAEKILGVGHHPNGLQLLKIQALQKRATELEKKVELLNIAVNFDQEGPVFTRDGNSVMQRKCINCGDCMTGCNVGAKNTVYMNYLPLAKLGGAHIFTQTAVRHVEKSNDDSWTVNVTRHKNRFVKENATLAARNIVLAAGALGSTEILLRSQAKGLGLAPGIGSRFGGNGDFFGTSYNSDYITNNVGWGNHPGDAFNRDGGPGPSIVGLVRYKTDAPFGQRFNMEDLTVPRAYRNFLALVGRTAPVSRTGTENLQAQHQRREKDAWHADPNGALNSSMMYLCMAHDDSAGRLYLDGHDALRIDWPDAGREPIFNEINQECFAHAKALGASFMEDATWHLSPWKTLVTAHPLGGCPMGEDGSHGVVDHLGKVFRDDTQAAHDGLYVADGSIIRSALEVNPFLTISALTERIAENIVASLTI
jgi:cholesterol oxidase